MLTTIEEPELLANAIVVRVLGVRSPMYTWHVSISNPFSCELIVRASTGSLVGGDKKSLMENEKTCELSVANMLVAVTVTSFVFPLH